MGRLVYTTIASFDGYVADADGNFDWAGPDDEVHAFVNDLERPVGTYLCGRGLYETMVYWETAPTDDPAGSVLDDYAQIWQSAQKVVYSSTLGAAASARTRVERAFDPEQVRAMVTAADADVSVGGPRLAGYALQSGLVSEIRLFLVPVVIGGGTRAMPEGYRVGLELLEERRFTGGTVFVRYAVRP
ncbi:MAG: dihydrofolate reductase family protein [Terracoccus sp.]